jgi:hypothetical protein
MTQCMPPRWTARASGRLRALPCSAASMAVSRSRVVHPAAVTASPPRMTRRRADCVTVSRRPRTPRRFAASVADRRAGACRRADCVAVNRHQRTPRRFVASVAGGRAGACRLAGCVAVNRHQRTPRRFAASAVRGAGPHA